jgi:hypothetical protein
MVWKAENIDAPDIQSYERTHTVPGQLEPPRS